MSPAEAGERAGDVHVGAMTAKVRRLNGAKRKASSEREAAALSDDAPRYIQIKRDHLSG